jgi:hypothetical protein
MALNLFVDKSDDQLSKLLHDNLNTEEQKLFVQSFQTYLYYGNDDKAFVINLDDVWKWVGFSNKGNAKTFLLKHFIENKDYTVELLQLQKQVYEGEKNHGGINKETVMMTVNTFKKFCMKASTKRADEICDYYVKMENIMHNYIIEKIKENKQKLLEMDTQLQTANFQIEVERHNVLIQTYSMKRLVYIMKVITLDDGSFIIKIGESENIKERVEKLSAEFGTKIIVLEIFTCEDSRAFEKFLHKYPEINKYKYSEPVNNKVSTELFKVSSKDYQKIVKYANKYLNNYNKDIEIMKLRIKEKELDIKSKIISICTSEDNLFKALELVNLSSVKDDESLEHSVEDEEDGKDGKDEKPIIEKKKEDIILREPISREYGPKVQIYDKNDLTKVIRVFNGITEATREIKDSSFTHIKYASKNKIVYLNYRWYLLDRNDPEPDKPKIIGETVIAKQNKNSFVAMLNLEKNNIEKVFQLQKDAAEYIQQQTSVICTAIKYYAKVGGYYWILWDDASQDLKNKYLEHNELPQKYKNVRGAKVQQIDSKTNEVIKIFPSIMDVVKEMKMSTKTIKKISIDNSIHKGFKWKII